MLLVFSLLATGGPHPIASAERAIRESGVFMPTVHPGSSPSIAIGSNTSSNLATIPHALGTDTPGGAWSYVSGLFPLTTGESVAVGYDNATAMAKVGDLQSSTGQFSDLSGSLLGGINQSTALAISGTEFGGGAVAGGIPAVAVWDAVFTWGPASPVLWQVNGTALTVQRVPGIPDNMSLLLGGAVSGGTVLLAGENSTSGSIILETWNASVGFQNISSVLPPSFGLPADVIGGSFGFLFTTNFSGTTLGCISYSAASQGWTFDNLSAALPTNSPFSSPALPVATAGANVVLESRSQHSPSPLFAILNTSSDSLVQVTASILMHGGGTPTAFATDPRAPGNITFASSTGLADLDTMDGAASNLSGIPPWPATDTPMALEWMNGVLIVGGAAPDRGFLGTWSGTGPLALTPLPSTPLVSPSTLVPGNGDLFVGGTNGTGGAGMLVNLTTWNPLPFNLQFPTGTGTVLASAFSPNPPSLGGTWYSTDGSSILSVMPNIGGVNRLPDPPERAMWDSVAVVNGSLWTGGTLPSGGSALFEYSAVGNNWTNLSSTLSSMNGSLTDIVAAGNGTAFLFGTGGDGTGDIWYFTGQNGSRFENITGYFGYPAPILSSGEAEWNGSALWLLNGTGVEVWDPIGYTLTSQFLDTTIGVSTFTSIAVAGSTFALGGWGNLTPGSNQVPIALVGTTAGNPLIDLTPEIGSSWLSPPTLGSVGNALLVGGELVTGTPSLDQVPPPLTGTMYANATMVDAPAEVQLALALSGGVSPYGSVHWTIPGQASLSGSSVTVSFASAGTYGLNASVNDSAGDSLNVSGDLLVNSPLSLSVNATPVAGTAPLPVQFSWSLSGGDPKGGNISIAFGDGNVSKGLANVSSTGHTYGRAGNYTVVFTGSDGLATVQRSLQVSVSAQAPVELLGVAISPLSPTVISGGRQSFSALPSCGPSNCPSGVAYSWRLSNGLASFVGSSTGATIELVAGRTTGTITVYVNATLDGQVRSAATHLTISPGPGTGAGSGGGGESAFAFVALGLGGAIIAVVGIWYWRRQRVRRGPVGRTGRRGWL
jgi:hypothetical protein